MKKSKIFSDKYNLMEKNLNEEQKIFSFLML